MPTSRRGAGLSNAATALSSQVKPTFLVPAMGMSVVGAVLAGVVVPISGLLHVLAVGASVYVAHLRDGYVDFYLRGEDNDIPLTEGGIWAAVVSTTAVFLGSIALLWLRGGGLAVALTAPLYVLAVLHAPYLDRHLLSVTIDYPTGIALTLLGGFAVQAESLTRTVVLVALAHLLLLAGIKVLLDGLDRDADRRIGKRTIPVVLGPARARFVSTVLVASAGVTLALGVGAGLLSPVVLAVAAVPLGTSFIGHRTSLRRATELVMSATYPFTAGIVVVVRPGLLW